MVRFYDGNPVTIQCRALISLLTCNDAVILIRMRVRITIACVLVAVPVWAQDSADLAMARQLGTEGLRAAEQGNCQLAVEKLARAEKLHHAPPTLERLGECEVALGHYVDGTENLRRVARERIADGSPNVFYTAQARAKTALEQALPHLAKVRIDVAGPPSGDVTLKIDNAQVSSAAIGVERPIDPGNHTIEATAPGFKATTQRFEVGDGASHTVSLTLERAPDAPKVVAITNTREAEPHTTTTYHRNYTPAIVAFGGAGVAVIFGGIFGGLALAKKNELVSACGGTACPPSQLGAFDDGKTFANLSTVGFVVAGVTAVVGVVLVVVAPRRAVVEKVSLGITPTGLFLGGAF